MRFDVNEEIILMDVRKEVADQLLLSKSLLEKIRFQAVPDPDHFFLATHILTAHDAAELALAAITSECGVLPQRDKHFLMDYLSALRTLHPERDVKGRRYFDQLNRVRVDIKHYGVFPDAKQWARVADNVYTYISELCSEYLDVSLDDLDESMLLTSTTVKGWYDQARTARADGKYREALECLAQAMFFLFKENARLRYLSVGRANPTDAIKLTGFGVHANDYLALQEFLPEVQETSDDTPKVTWKQGEYGHPGNWREDAASFCLKTFLDIALKIQSARWIPGAISFVFLYEYQVTAMRDVVEIWRPKSGPFPSKDKSDKEPVRTLRKGETIRGQVSRYKEPRMMEAIIGGPDEDILYIMWSSSSIWASPPGSGYVETSAVKVTCVPRDNNLVHEYFPDLQEIAWEPEESD
jgi:hypothetical protein